MPYGLKYTTQFDSEPDDNNPAYHYTLEFLFKDYAGPVASVAGGSTTVLQHCSEENPLAPIKGQSLDITLINPGNLAITNFYADNDNDIQIRLLKGLDVVFIGFLVQDDCNEIKVDYEHEIQLSATDSLGLLKDVPFNNAPASYDLLYTSLETITTTAPHTLQTDLGFGAAVEVGDRIRIIGTAQAGDYTVSGWVISGVHYDFTVLEPIGTMGSTVTTIGLLRSNLSSRITILSVIKRCMSATSLQLLTNIFCNLREARQTVTESHFAQTIIDPDTFRNGDVYKSCYEVLSEIMATWECQLQQANGQWNIVHWYEIRIFGGVIAGFVYDQDWALIGTTAFANIFNIAPNIPPVQPPTCPIFPLTESILRPFKFTRKQFNYQQPKYLLKNYDLQTLGPLLRTYVSGGVTVNEYIATGWTSGQGSPLVERFIRVDIDTATGTELRRYLVTKNAGDQSFGVRGTAVEVTAGDKIKFSFTFRTTSSQAGNINYTFIVQLTNGVLIRYVDELPVGNGDWKPTFGFTYNIPSGDNSDQWHTVEIESSQVPFDGLLYVFLPQATFSPNSVKETWIRDIRLEVTTFINDSAKVIGHYHLDNRTNDIKNNLDEEIFIDDTPRNTIGGTLFMPTFTNLIQDRTIGWVYGAASGPKKLGNLTVAEILTYRDKMRSKLEGGFIGIQQTYPISLLTLLQTSFNPTKYYIFGLLTIDYKRNVFNGTLWEIWDTVEPALAADYTFNYIYSTS